MHKIINNYDTYLKTIAEISKDQELLISTYGISIDNRIDSILKNSSSFKIIVGLYDRYCFPGCEHCANNINNKKKELFQYQQTYGFDNIIGVQHLHKKIVISNNTVIIGGFNLTGSDFIDNAIAIYSKDGYNICRNDYLKLFSNIKREKLDIDVRLVVSFGKYRGQTFDVMWKDSNYISFMHSKMDSLSFETKIKLDYKTLKPII